MLSLLSPAKVNLFFRVLKKREDGFHEIASLFQAINLVDTLQIERTRSQDLLTCTHPSLPCNESNLVLKAANLFRKKTGLSLFARMHLIKKIPMQAGLGGGSSNAATTLWGFNELAGRPASLKDLTEWGSELGSDISFFFSKGSAYCTGRGEKIEKVETAAQPFSFWIASPRLGLSTPEVYRNLQPDILKSRDPRHYLQKFMRGEQEFFNDLESSAFQLMPELEKLKKKLYQLGFHTVTMTGSGSSFCCFGTDVKCEMENLTFYQVKSLSRHEERWY